MHRLFVALEPPPRVRDRLLAAMGGVAGARWQRDDQLHCTLRFVGEVDRHAAQDIAAALGGVRHPAVEVTLGEPGVFDRRGRIDTLWVGAGPFEPLHALKKAVDAALVRAGVPPEARAFRPHITLARFGRLAGDAGGFVPQVPLAGLGWRADAFALYESTLGHDGADYEIVERYPL